MSRWRLPRPVVGAKRIRRGSSVGGSKPLAPNQTPASHHTLLLLSFTSLLSSQQHTTQISLSTSPSLASLSTLQRKGRRRDAGGRGKTNPLTARRSPRTTAMSAAAAAAGEGGGKEKGPGGACELCGAAARVYCGADEATLCWGCDAQVHGANFLVARHARALLCRGCARPTPWRAAGPRLGPTASLCDRCVRRGGGGGGPGGVGASGAGVGAGVGGDVEMGGVADGRHGDEDSDGEDDDEVVVEEDEDDDEEEEGEGENQVVPWTEEADATPPPVASSTSSSSREVAANGTNAAECAKVPPLSPPLLFRHLVPTPPLCLQRCKFSSIGTISSRIEDVPCSTSQPSLCHYSDEATSSRNGGRFLSSRHRKRSPSDFLGSGSAQTGSGSPARNCSNAGIGRNE
ncbi:hypothetical protein HU200_028841 [Digitaria exilis]|uniref:B box-type domain-containing protein n=1 Tax=Digitaria exilis TaxID=1010633 RepID=A0A835BW80_9POAL|nr:hypothetical protein HU200_028841 [Digitaria exilis]